MKKLLSLFTAVFSIAFSADAQDFGTIQALVDQAVVIEIEARTVETSKTDDETDDTEKEWNMETSFITLPGRQVKLSLKGNNITITAYLTPYKSDDGNVLLVAQGEMKVTDPETGTIKYYSDMKDVEVEFGEQVIYFPLGYAGLKNSKTNIELDIVLYKYKDYLLLAANKNKE